MSIIDRHLIRAVIGGSALVLVTLVSLTGFINFVGQLERVGRGQYELPQALVYVVFSAPTQAYEMFPVAVLLGALLGLGQLASQSELIVMRASGVSVWRLAGSVMLAGLFLMLLAAALGELIAPPAKQYASRLRTVSMHADLSIAGGESAWIKDGNLIVNIERRLDQRSLGGVYLFSFDDQRQITSISRALSAGFGKKNQWVLNDFRESSFTADGVSAQHLPRTERPTTLRSELIDLSVIDPDSLETAALYEYSSYLRDNDLDAEVYEIAFWSRLATMVSVLLMAVLALPFVFGPLRSAGAGQRLMVGLLIGLTYLIGARTLSSSGQVFDVEPFVIGWIPTAVLSVALILGLLRTR